MKKLTGIVLVLILAFTSCQEKKQKQEFIKQEFNFGLTQFVNPFIGTGGHGHTYPGAAAPFGMMQLSPDTRLSGWDGCGGYHYSDSIVYGFSHTHLSGTGCTDYGDVLLMPTTGELHMDNGAIDPANGYCSKFSHENEKASPGYYSVLLDDYHVQVELTTQKRSGIHKYTFNEGGQAHVILDLLHRDKVLSSNIEIIDDHTIKGHRRSQEWARDQHMYFYIQFSKPFVKHGFEKDGEMTQGQKAEGSALKAYFDFDTKAGEAILAKVGMSAVSTDGAKKNLEAEVGSKTFEETLAEVTQLWENELGKIVVKGGSEDDKQIFYTALYHAFLNPNLFTDVDGQYRGMDLKVHQTEGHDMYTVFSLWDTFRAEHPLFTITQQQRTLDFVNTFIKMYEQGGRLPVWELCANETDCMIGYHSVPVIADAYMKGLRGFDAEKALEAMISSANEDHFGLKYYKKFGYIPASMESESVSKTLEYAYDDWCIAVMAKEMGRTEVYNEFIQRAQYWKNLYDESSRFMRAKMDASWFAPFDPKEVNFNYTEANAWQYNFFVPHDVNSMMEIMGGEVSFSAFLDQLFNEAVETTGRHQADITGLIGQYAHGNEPSHHMAYLYNFAGQPWKTQQKVRQIMTELYTTQPDGLSGNEDCGQMSAWYVLSAMGFYSVTPGLDEYVIGSPVFDEIIINIENGKEFKIIAKGNSPEHVYIQSASLDGVDYQKTFIRHQDILNGSELILQMGAEPNMQWGTKAENRPKTAIENMLIVPVPSIDGVKVFKGSSTVEIHCVD
ncbi:MAG: GH92 family glycosyl hydrolase, partial [Bacteroidales bacterium]|nr:GH92 family glycosyl hydrolase [Bacteroidales bacterium]